MSQPASSLDLFTDSLRLMGDATMLSVIELESSVDAGLMERALSRCLDAYPILTAKLVRDGGPAHWEQLGRSPGDDKVEVIVTDRWEDPRPLFINPIDPYRPPQVRVRVFRSDRGDTIVIALAHAASDGTGLKQLSRSLLQAYVEPASVPRAAGGLPERDTRWTSDLNDGINIRQELKIVDPMWPSSCPPSKARSAFHRADIPAEGVAKLRSVARSHGGSINDVLMAAYFLTMSDLTGHYGPQSLFFPVDLRRYLPPGTRIMTNQSINVSFRLTRDKGEGMSGLLDKIVNETTRMKTGRLGIEETVIFDRGSDATGAAMQRMVEAMHALERKGLADVFISNPGPFDLPAFPGLKNAFICYPGCYMPATCFVTSTFRDSMTITMGYQDDLEPREATRRAMRGFLDHLLLSDVSVY